jgi:hypothetical protein
MIITITHDHLHARIITISPKSPSSCIITVSIIDDVHQHHHHHHHNHQHHP